MISFEKDFITLTVNCELYGCPFYHECYKAGEGNKWIGKFCPFLKTKNREIDQYRSCYCQRRSLSVEENSIYYKQSSKQQKCEKCS